MSIKVGGIDLGSAIINLEYELGRTQRLLEWIVNNNVGITAPPPNVVSQIDNEAIAAVQKKHPDAGITKK